MRHAERGLAIFVRAGALGVAVAFGACTASTDAPPASCPASPGGTCPSPPPSWNADVQPIVDRRCNPCHFPGGVETQVPHPLDYSTYSGVRANSSTIELVVSSCIMPPSDAGALTPDQRRTLLDWIACGAPEN